MGNVHIRNQTRIPVRVYVSQKKFVINELKVNTSIETPRVTPSTDSTDSGVKVSAIMSHTLYTKGYAWLGPGKSLEFAFHPLRGDVFVSVTYGWNVPVSVACHNYNPPHGREVVIIEENIDFSVSPGAGVSSDPTEQHDSSSTPGGSSLPMLTVMLARKTNTAYDRGMSFFTAAGIILLIALLLIAVRPLLVTTRDSLQLALNWFGLLKHIGNTD